MPTDYETSIRLLLKLDKIIDKNREIINLTDITNKLITYFIVGYFTIKLTKYSFKALNYIFFYSDPYKPYF